MKRIYKKFESLAEFDAFLSGSETQPRFKGKEESQIEYYTDNNFAGTKDFGTAQKLFMFGDKANADRLECKGIAKLRRAIRLTENRRQIFSDVTGFAPNVPNFLAGVPTNMLNARQKRTKARVLNVAYNISVNGNIDSEDMQDVAIKILSAIWRVEANGVRINLYLCDLAQYTNTLTGWLCRIKTSGQHLDVLKTAYPLTNTSMLRRHSFRFTEVLKGLNSSSYGAASRDTEGLYKYCGLRDVVTLNYYAMRYKTTDEIVKFILDGAN